MSWNWELPDWPKFHYDVSSLQDLDKEFLLGAGGSFAFLKTIDEMDRKRFVVDILSTEGAESSRIEGESLDRESLQSSIRKHFGLDGKQRTRYDKEFRMAELLCRTYETFDEPLTHEMLWEWHGILFENDSHLEDKGRYRTHLEPMQIVSNRFGSPVVFFEAPPSKKIPEEMESFIQWYNAKNMGSILGKAAIAHVYFESIHPFEDGNGRIGRILTEKLLSQSVKQPTLIAISKKLEENKKEYYSELEQCNQTLEVQNWVEFFSKIILQSHNESMENLYFLIEKSKMMNALSHQLNPRQSKVLLRMFAEGPGGFKGDLSAEKYIAITKAPRATVTRDLNDLVKKGALVKLGELRHTKYRLNIPFQ